MPKSIVGPKFQRDPSQAVGRRLTQGRRLRNAGIQALRLNCITESCGPGALARLCLLCQSDAVVADGCEVLRDDRRSPGPNYSKDHTTRVGTLAAAAAIKAWTGCKVGEVSLINEALTFKFGSRMVQPRTKLLALPPPSLFSPKRSLAS